MLLIGAGVPARPARRAATVGAHRRRATSYAQIEGTGSTWSELIVQQWIADVDANGMKVVYTGGGSSKGRKDFSQNSTDFAISEIPYQGTDEQGNADTSNGRAYAYLPIVAGGTAFTYQLKIGGKLVRNLRLSGETIAKIFTNQITNWNDPAITTDNNGRAFPSLPIIPVVRSDGSGTTAQFTHLDGQRSTPTSGGRSTASPGSRRTTRARAAAVGQAGSDQVMNTIAGLRRQRDDRVRRVLLPAQQGLPGRQGAQQGGLLRRADAVQRRGRADQGEDQPGPEQPAVPDPDPRRASTSNPDPRTYPLSSYSYMIIPTGADRRRG